MFKPELKGFEQEPSAEKLKNFLERAAGELRQDGVPADTDMRINADAFAGVYPPAVLESDKKLVQEYQKIFGEKGEKKSTQETFGEQLEMLKTAVFYKNLKNDFIVIRSSFYDDIKNKIDNVLLDRRTGNLVCAFDEVCDTTGDIYEGKKEKVLMKNTSEHGVKLKYGLGIERESGAFKVIKQSAEHIPIFYLALPKKHLRTALEQFNPSASVQSPFESKLFYYFIAALDLQMKDLELRVERLHPELKRRLLNFGKVLKERRG